MKFALISKQYEIILIKAILIGFYIELNVFLVNDAEEVKRFNQISLEEVEEEEEREKER